jgi:hypothetical protein
MVGRKTFPIREGFSSTLAMDGLGPAVRKRVLHGFDVGRRVPQLLRAPIDPVPDPGEPLKNQRPVAVAEASDLDG